MSENGTQPVYPPSYFNEYTIAFEGASLANILYGVYVVIAIANLSLLRKKRYRVLGWFTVFQLVVTTLYIGMSLYAAPAQSLGIFGISGNYTPDSLSPWPSIVVNVAFILNTWASDGFLLYRCHVVCMGNKYAMAFSTLLYLATLGSSLAWLVYSSTPGAVYSTQAVQTSGIWFWSCSAAMNVCVSCMISIRLWMHRQAITRAIGSLQGTFYLGYMAMTLESAMLYTAFDIVALVVFTANSPLENVFFPVLGTVQVIAPALIVYRIARGIAFETDEYGGVVTSSSMRFGSSGRTPKAFLRPTRREMLDGADSMQVFSESDAKTDRDGFNSFVRENKEDV